MSDSCNKGPDCPPEKEREIRCRVTILVMESVPGCLPVKRVQCIIDEIVADLVNTWSD